MTEITAALIRSEYHYDPETGYFTRLVARGGMPVGSLVGWIGKRGYWEAEICGTRQLLHRLAWLYVHGKWPEGEIDHRNRRKADNRFINLRDVSSVENMRNVGRKRNNTTGIVGVYWFERAKKWTAAVTVRGKQIHLGYFSSIEDAAAAREAGVRRHY